MLPLSKNNNKRWDVDDPIPIEQHFLIRPIQRNTKVAIPTLARVLLELFTGMCTRLLVKDKLVLSRRCNSALQTVVYPARNVSTVDELNFFDSSAKTTIHVKVILSPKVVPYNTC